MIKVCAMCCKDFNAKDDRVKYCSDECRKKVTKKNKQNRRANMTVEQKEIEKKKRKAEYENKYMKEKEKEEKRECLNCKKKFTAGIDGAKYKYCSTECSEEVRRRKNKERWRKANPGWNDGTNKVCEWCGKEFTVPARNAHRTRFCNEKCNSTWWSRTVHGYKPIEERNEERRKQKLIRQKRLEKERLVNTVKRSIKSVIKVKEEELRIKELTKSCSECHESFYNPLPNTLTCSNECRRKRNNRQAKLYSSTRLNETNIVDRDITLEKLYERDSGICYLCGGECDYYDHVITLEGYYIVGSRYPSIDHVTAIANGGMHSWNNIKLAHHRCNSLKRDINIEDYLKVSV